MKGQYSILDDFHETLLREVGISSSSIFFYREVELQQKVSEKEREREKERVGRGIEGARGGVSHLFLNRTITAFGIN